MRTVHAWEINKGDIIRACDSPLLPVPPEGVRVTRIWSVDIRDKAYWAIEARKVDGREFFTVMDDQDTAEVE